jgi:adenylate cyclase
MTAPKIRLSSIARCFEGIVPANITTCSRDGIPNLAALSQVHFIDERHVALSRQFFNKTTRNILENPRAQVSVWDPISFDVFILSVRYVRSETAGPLFESMAARIEAIAAHTGMQGIFKLQASDIFEVLDVFAVSGHLDPPDAQPPDAQPPDDELPTPPGRPPEAREELWVLQRISLRMNQAVDLDDLLGGVLDSLAEDFGFTHTQVLLLDETGRRLFTIASHGYDQSGVGSEVVFGEGLIGNVARDRRLLRVGHLEAEMRYGRTLRASFEQPGAPGSASRPEIPLAGLPDAQSLMAVPLLVQDRLVGVLAIESRERHAFEVWHEAFLGVVANQVAASIQRLAQAEPQSEQSDEPARVKPAAPPVPPAVSRRRRQLTFYQNDDCVFADGEYLIRNVPGRILWKILKAHVQDGRTELTNRELRLDPGLGLPAIKDNLESRLILLRKRLEQKCPDIRLPPCGRGRFAIEVDSDLALSEKPFA